MGITFEYPEGATPIDLDEAASLIPSIATQAELNEFEALNIAEAIDWAYRSRAIKKTILDRAALKLLHEKMFNKTWRWAGKYRLTAKKIGVEAWRIPAEIQLLIDDTLVWIETKVYEQDELAARFHHRLVSIHPFPNGNGRHARLATDLLCRQIGVPMRSWGSNTVASHAETRATYIEALRCADGHDLAPLSNFIRS